MDLNYDNDWYRYFGSSTVYISGRHGLSVHFADSGKSGEADRGEDSPAGEDSGRLGQNHAGDGD